MLLIGNLGGFLWLLAMVIVAGSMHDHQFGFITGNLISSVVSLPIAIIFGLIGLKPRVFFIPAWMLSLLLICVQFWKAFGWYSLGFMALTLAVIIPFFRNAIKKKSQKDWEKAQAQMTAMKAGTFDAAMRRSALAGLFVTDSNLVKRDEVLAHNEYALECVMQEFPELIGEEDGKVIQEHVREIRAAKDARDPRHRNLSLKNKVGVILKARLLPTPG